MNNPSPLLRMFLRNFSIDEFVYPLHEGRRYTADDVPPIMCATLPHLTDEPEELWEELGPVLRARGRGSLMAHYRFVFEWLRERFDRKVWVERNGGTLPVAPVLARHFPDARFVHVFRDGRDTAISMYNHPGFRGWAANSLMLKKMGLDPFSHRNWPGSSPWFHIVARLAGRLVAEERLVNREVPPVEAFGWVWNGLIERGTAFLDTLARERVLSMRFETLLESPREEMARFIDFVGPELADERWLEEVAALPRQLKPRWPGLPADQQARLAEVCAPGQETLGYVDCPGSGGRVAGQASPASLGARRGQRGEGMMMFLTSTAFLAIIEQPSAE